MKVSRSIQVIAVHILLVSGFALFVFGCSYKTLNIFFDGVPKPQDKTTAAAKSGDQLTPQLSQTAYKHAPFEEGACDSCHNPQRGHVLVAAKEELCVGCHSFEPQKKYVHGPVASGDCLLCHEPHTSQFPRLLVSEPKAFCSNCHDPESLSKTESHMRTDLQCTVCHDAHMSDKEFLLK